MTALSSFLSPAEIKALLEKEAGQPVRLIPASYDRAALFLIDLGYDNLFEPVDALDYQWLKFRCKLCGKPVMRHKRENHHRDHKREIG